MTTPNATSFVVYRWTNPQTTSDYPFLAVAQDRSALLSLGDYGATLDWGIGRSGARVCDPGLGQLLASSARPRCAGSCSSGRASDARCVRRDLRRAGGTPHGEDHRAATATLSRRVVAWLKWVTVSARQDAQGRLVIGLLPRSWSLTPNILQLCPP